MRRMIAALLLLPALVTVVNANSFTAAGTALEATHGYDWNSDRILVNDGSFESGCDVYWTCETDNNCTWITDLVPLGLWNYDGSLVAWLGGFCGGEATCYTSICQDVYIADCVLTWWWMAYVNYGETAQYPFFVKVTVDGSEIFSFSPLLADHLQGYQMHEAWVWFGIGGTHRLCFELHNEYGCLVNEVDNYFVDYVDFPGLTPIEAASFSTVKSLY